MPRSKADERWIRQCKGCGEPFWQPRPKAQYCSTRCSSDHRDQWAKPVGGSHPAAGLERRQCVVCEKEYQPVRVSQLACSRPCKKRLPSQRAWEKDIERRERQNKLKRDRSQEGRSAASQKNRAWRLRTKYGLTVEDFDQMLAAQGGVCAICGNPPKPDGVRAASRLHPDHDHVTNRNRDLLCLSCNVGVGHFRDDPALMRAAAEYIERHRAAVRQEESRDG